MAIFDRNCITNNLFSTLLILDAVPEMRLCADLSHYGVDREMMLPISPEMQSYVSRILERSDSLQGRIATRSQIQLPIGFAQHRVWLETFLGWWKEGFSRWRTRARDQDLVFLGKLGPPNYPIPDANGDELSDRWQQALLLRRPAGGNWMKSRPAALDQPRISQCPSVARRPREARRSCDHTAAAWRDSAFLNSSLSVTRLGPLRRSLKCLYLHTHDLGCVQPCSGRGGAWLDRKRVCRRNTDALQQDTPVLIPTACQGLVT